jgi:hypothetical protein
MAYALEFIRNAAMEVAMARLGLALRPDDRYSISAQPAAQQQLIEVSSTDLVGAWVARRLAGWPAEGLCPVRRFGGLSR